jgi:membrane protein implicated in regulation of membrane protease activity
VGLAIFAVVMTTDAWMIWMVLGTVAPSARLGAVAALVAFVMSFGLLLSFVRPLARRHLYTPQASWTGAAALIGRTAMVTEHVDKLQLQRCLPS